MGLEDIACVMIQNRFLDHALKAKLGTVKQSTFAYFNKIIESHEAGKKAANSSASANVVKGKGKPCQQSNQGKQDQISHAEREQCKKITGKCFRCGRSDHLLMAENKISASVKCNLFNNIDTYISMACSKRQTARSTQSQPTPLSESADSTL